MEVYIQSEFNTKNRSGKEEKEMQIFPKRFLQYLIAKIILLAIYGVNVMCNIQTVIPSTLKKILLD